MESMKTKGRWIAIATGLLALVVLVLAACLGFLHLRFWYSFESLEVYQFKERSHRIYERMRDEKPELSTADIKRADGASELKWLCGLAEDTP